MTEQTDHTTEPNKFIWYEENQDGTRRLTNMCCCDKCWTTADESYPRPKRLEAHTNAPEGATYEYNGVVRDAKNTAQEVWRRWGNDTDTAIDYWMQMICALRPGDSYTTDEPWEDKETVTRLT